MFDSFIVLIYVGMYVSIIPLFDTTIGDDVFMVGNKIGLFDVSNISTIHGKIH